LRLFKEGKYTPAIAIGLQDMLGDGLFSGEYLVASKAVWKLDFTAGFGFGNMASRAKISNITRLFGNGFKTRTFDNTNSEKLRLGNYFSGEKMGFFAGVEYQTPIKGLLAKLEYSTVDKRLLNLFENYESKTAFNIGLNYKIKDWLEVGAGVQHGNQIALQFTLKQNLHNPIKLNFADGPEIDEIRSRELSNIPENANDFKTNSDEDIIFERLSLMGYAVNQLDVIDKNSTITLISLNEENENNILALGAILEQYESVVLSIKNNDTQNLTVLATDELGIEAINLFKGSAFFQREKSSVNLSEDKSNIIATEIYERLDAKALKPNSVDILDDEIVIFKEVGPFIETSKNIGRTSRILSQTAPDNVERFNIISTDKGLKVSNISVLRKDIENLSTYNGSPEELLSNTEINEPDNVDYQQNNKTSPRFNFNVFPDLVTHFGSSKDDHFKADLNIIAAAKVKITNNLRMNAEVKQHLIGDLDLIPVSTNTNVPHVRSDIGLYSKEGSTSIRRLTAEYNENPIKNIYTRLTVGHLEEMYSGISGEVLYQPFASSIGVGLDINYVKKRGFEQLFSLKYYQTVTGHETAYYVNKNYDITTKISVGRYLAKDWGTTIDISREFDSGIRIGAMATFTNMSESDYGAGSFDKGIYMTIPFDFFWMQQSRERAIFKVRRLGKNGGQKIDHKMTLFEILNQSQPYKIRNNWNKIVD
ncbi:MAG: YjbH domain-containing protein, partial [Emcibacteraceae bacterium]|nr:YjbH domain-containing protein [Emcibacteraceae bacterium]